MYPTKEEVEERMKAINDQLETLQKEEAKLTKAKEKLLHERYLLELIDDFIDEYKGGEKDVYNLAR